MSLQAYKSAAQQVETPRDLEYRLFTEVTRALMEAQRMDEACIGQRMEALDWNRRVWAALAADCADVGNRLPDATRAGIISLSLWVDRHTAAVFARQETFEPLIEVNRTVMQGLAA